MYKTDPVRRALARFVWRILDADILASQHWRIIPIARRWLNDVPIPSPYGPLLLTRFGDGTWEITMSGQREIDAHLADLAPGDVFLDVGANDGSYTLVASRRVGAQGTVFAVEPNPYIFGALVVNLELNGCRNVVALNLAVGSTPGLVEFSHSPEHSGAGRSGAAGSGRLRWRALVERFDASSSLARACAGRPMVIKIDVEGAELEALEGLAGVIDAASVKKVIVEIDARNLERFGATPGKLIAFLRDRGLVPTVGSDSAHYDEVFVSEPAP